jgi:hypothetical protein
MPSPAVLAPSPPPPLADRLPSTLLLRRAISVDVRPTPGGKGSGLKPAASQPVLDAATAPAPAGVPAPRGLLRALSASTNLEPELSLR